MKRFLVLALNGLVVLSASTLGITGPVQSEPANARDKGDQICIYKDVNFKGAEACYHIGDEIDGLAAQHNISSIRLYGIATVTVFERSSFSGHSAQVSSDIPDLRQSLMSGKTPWLDHITSLRVTRASRAANEDPNTAAAPSPDQNPPAPRRTGICVYDLPHYEGLFACWDEGQNISDLVLQENWGGRISSIRVFGGSIAIVYQDVAYRGESLTVAKDIPDLTSMLGRNVQNGNGKARGNEKQFTNWNNEIFSLRVRGPRQ